MKPAFEMELNQQGSMSYGYGYWSRFKYYGKHVSYVTPKFMSMSKLISREGNKELSLL